MVKTKKSKETLVSSDLKYTYRIGFTPVLKYLSIVDQVILPSGKTYPIEILYRYQMTIPQFLARLGIKSYPQEVYEGTVANCFT